MELDQAINAMQCQLVFRMEDGLLHLLDEQSELILHAFQQGITIDEICNAWEMDDSSACQEKLASLKKQWLEIGLLAANSESNQDSLYQILIRPGIELIKITTNCNKLSRYLSGIYLAVCGSSSKIMSTLNVNKLSDNDYRIYIGRQEKYQVNNLENAILWIGFEIGELATHEEPRLFVAHAAAVANDQNVWLMPAQAGSGKSTLTAVLLKNGYQLINDDIVPVNHDGTITALNLPLKIKSGAWSVLEPIYLKLRQAEVILRADGQQMKNLALPSNMLCPAGERLNTTGIIVPKFDPQCKNPKIELLAPSQKLQLFLQSEPYFPHRLTRPYLQKILDWLEPIPAWYIRYGNSQKALQLLQNL